MEAAQGTGPATGNVTQILQKSKATSKTKFRGNVDNQKSNRFKLEKC